MSLEHLSPEAQKYIRENYAVIDGPVCWKRMIHELPSQEAFMKVIDSRKVGPQVITETLWLWGNNREGVPIVAGVVGEDTTDKDWSWVLLMRDEHKEFRAIEVGVSLPSEEKAEEILRSKMHSILKSGKEFEPQGD